MNYLKEAKEIASTKTTNADREQATMFALIALVDQVKLLNSEVRKLSSKFNIYEECLQVINFDGDSLGKKK